MGYKTETHRHRQQRKGGGGARVKGVKNMVTEDLTLGGADTVQYTGLIEMHS